MLLYIWQQFGDSFSFFGFFVLRRWRWLDHIVLLAKTVVCRCSNYVLCVCMWVNECVCRCINCTALFRMPKSVFWHIQIVAWLILEGLDNRKPHEVQFLEIWSKPHLEVIWNVITNFYDASQSFASLGKQHTATMSSLAWWESIRTTEQSPCCY